MSATASRAMLSRESSSNLSIRRKSTGKSNSSGPSGAAKSGLRVGAPNDAFEREADRIASAVSIGGSIPAWSLAQAGFGQIQRGANPLHIQRQWADAPLGPIGGATSAVITAPSFGWNRGEVNVGKVRRIPVEGLTVGNKDADPNPAAEESANNRAVVLIPAAADLKQPVEVLLHLHGHNVGYRQRRTAGKTPTLTKGSVRDVETDRIEQQLEASSRPIIGILPEGTTGSGFGGFDSNALIADVFRVLATMGVFGNDPAPSVARVVLSGHSGAGRPIADMLSEPGQPRLPSSLGEVAIFDAINSDSQLNAVQAWVGSRLNLDLSALNAPGVTSAQQQAYLQTSLRFRAYYTNSSYLDVHQKLKQAIDAWFNRHAKELGGSSSPNYASLRSNYQVIPVNHGEHEVILSKGDKLLDALRALPAAGGQTGPATTSPSTGQQSGAAPPDTLQRKALETGEVDEGAHSLVGPALSSPGRRLDPAAQAFFSSRFQHDFADVRIHSDEKAAASASALNAEAYTLGKDIVFGGGFYDTASQRGVRLLAHELTHVVQQSKNAPSSAPTLQRQVAAPAASEANLSPVRSDEKGKFLNSFNFGKFSIFVPEKVSLGSRNGVDNLKVHVFFSAGSVQGDIGDDLLTHGIRGASAESEWITIGVPARTTISDGEITSCLASIGITSDIKSLRLSGHSRGAFSLMNSITQRKITTLSLIEHVFLLDADENPSNPRDQESVTNTPKVEVLKGAGIPTSKITAYEVNVRKRHISGATYLQLDSGSMAAIGYVRLINDAMITQAGIAALVSATPAIKSQLDTLPLPPRGSFTTGTPGANQKSLVAFSSEHASEIKAIIAKDSTRDGLLTFINTNNLVRFAPFKFDRSISAHHFFAAEVAHELTE